jgi:Ca2+-binding RTX toxin-like protein
VNLSRGWASGGEGADRLRSIEDAAGSSHHDALVGNGDPNKLYGRNGDDTLRAGVGNDILDGGDGNDLLAPGPGVDEVNGGDGTDVFDYRDVPAGVTIHLSSEQNATRHGIDYHNRMEGVRGTRFADRLTGFAFDSCIRLGGVWFEAGPGDDHLTGTACIDHLDGGPGRDRLDGSGNAFPRTGADSCINGEVVLRC